MTFKKADWINDTNVYEVNLRQYSPDSSFTNFLKELPRLKDMGIETLWFMPVTPIAQKNKKGSLGSQYACSDYTSINAEFGTLETFRHFITEAHSLGFKVIIDWVANHTGWDHVWTKTHPEYYRIDPSTNDFKIASGMDDIIELDYKNPDLRSAMVDAMKFWVTECDIDGFRCDLAFWVELSFWIEARTEIEKTKTLFWLAESDPVEKPAYYAAFDACYAWTWMHKTEDFYKYNHDVQILNHTLDLYEHAGNKLDIKLWFTANHDENSWNGTEYEKYGEAAAALAVHSITWDGIPLIYSGQELPNRKRLQFFEKDVIAWDGKFKLHDFYRTLLNLRKNNPALNAADPLSVTTRLKSGAGNNILAWVRRNRGNEVLVIMNMSRQEAHYTIGNGDLKGQFTEVFTRSQMDFSVEQSFTLLPWSYLVYEKDQ